MADDSSCEDDIPISQLKKTDDSSFEDDDIPISQLKRKKSESTIMSVLSAMKNDPELNTKIPPEKLELISGFASKHFSAESEISNASTMAKDYSKDALLLMSKQYPTKFLDLDFKDCDYINDSTLHPLIHNMGTSDIPHDWGTQCWEIRQWRKLSQEAQDQFLLINVDDTKSVSNTNTQKEEEDSFLLCANCGKEGSDVTNTCNKCKSVKYCNAACKKKHRSKHKKACERYVAAGTDKIHRPKHEKARERFVTQGDVLRVVLPIEQINDPFGQQCDTSECQLAACCIWSRSRDPSTPWYCCLDCQEKDFKGWPADNKDIPLKVMSRALHNAMIERVRLAPCFVFDIVCSLLLY